MNIGIRMLLRDLDRWWYLVRAHYFGVRPDPAIRRKWLADDFFEPDPSIRWEDKIEPTTTKMDAG